MNIREFHRDYLERMNTAVKSATQGSGFKHGEIKSIANSLTLHAFEQKTLTQEKVEWILKSWINGDEKEIEKAAFQIVKEMNQ